jgi:hypothetical protein
MGGFNSSSQNSLAWVAQVLFTVGGRVKNFVHADRNNTHCQLILLTLHLERERNRRKSCKTLFFVSKGEEKRKLTSPKNKEFSIMHKFKIQFAVRFSFRFFVSSDRRTE